MAVIVSTNVLLLVPSDVMGITLTPGAPVRLAVALVHSGSGWGMHFTWEAPRLSGTSPIIRYECSASSPSQGTIGTVVTPTDRHCDFYNTVKLGEQATLSVKAVNIAGAGTPSTTTFAMPNVPGAAKYLIASAEAVVSGKLKIVISWQAAVADPGNPVTGYIVQVTGPNSYDTLVGLPGLSQSVSGLEIGSDYKVTVWAQSQLGPGAGAVMTYTTPVRPDPPVGISAAVTTTSAGASVKLAWQAPADGGRAPITGYVASVPTLGKSCNTTGSASGSCVIGGFTPGRTYEVDVVATNMVGSSNPATLSFTVPVTAQPATAAPASTSAAPASPSAAPASPSAAPASPSDGPVAVESASPYASAAELVSAAPSASPSSAPSPSPAPTGGAGDVGPLIAVVSIVAAAAGGLAVLGVLLVVRWWRRRARAS